MNELWVLTYTDITYFVYQSKIISSLYDDRVFPESFQTIFDVALAIGGDDLKVRYANIDELIGSRLGDDLEDESTQLDEWIAAEGTAIFHLYELEIDWRDISQSEEEK